jgi:hypothetical protein
MKTTTIAAMVTAMLTLPGVGPGMWRPPSSEAAAATEAPDLDHTPPRLAYTHGEISFSRAGAAEWGPAQVNTPLAPGDRLYAAPGGTLELQVGARAFVRASGGQGGAEIGLDGLESNYLQLSATSGTVALDVRELTPGYAIDVNTPAGVLSIEHSGYYRIEVGPDRAAFLAYRGAGATLTLEDGARRHLAASEQAVVLGGAAPRLEITAAPGLTEWDRWNHERTDSLLNAASARYVAPGAYGMSDLDQHGTWRTVPGYGWVWMPAGVPAGWAPYSTGRWIWDPYFEWTWVDDAPWGWAPYHYGRWVHVGSYWAWAPGPIAAPVHYAPALVAFLDPPSVIVSRPISWVALGWGEPCVPWWGGARFAGRPWWGGWGGPRVVNKVVVHHTTVVNVTSIKGYRNADVRHAVVTVPGERFGRGPVAAARLAGADVTGLRPARGTLAIRPTPASLVPTGHAVKPRAHDRRRVVAVRAPADVSPRLRAAGFDSTPAPAVSVPRAKVVPGHATLPEVVPERRSPRVRGVDQLDHRRTPPLLPRSPGGPGASSEMREADDQRDRPGRGRQMPDSRESTDGARHARSERRVSPAPRLEAPSQPAASPSVARQIPALAPRPEGPTVPAPRQDPRREVSPAREAPRPARGPQESPKTRERPAQRRPEIERRSPPAPVQVQRDAPVVNRPRPPAVETPGEARRLPAMPVVEPAGRPGNDRIERGRPADLGAPRAAAPPKPGRSDQPGKERREEPRDRKSERGSR